mgnify:CR=1 FL=1
MPKAESTSKPPRRILVIDDDDDALFVLRTLLSAKGYAVETASNGLDGLKAVALKIPDLIILHVIMPGMNGVQLTRKLKEQPRTAAIPLIMLTALTDKKYMQAALFELDVDFYLTKPFDHDELLDKVHHAIRFRRIAPDAVKDPEQTGH